MGDLGVLAEFCHNPALAGAFGAAVCAEKLSDEGTISAY